MDEVNDARKFMDAVKQENTSDTAIGTKKGKPKEEEPAAEERVVASEEVSEEVVPEEGEEDLSCQYCNEYPCVWEKKEGEMRLYDECEHGHFPVEDKPPNNIHCKKVYRQMFFFINEGPAGKGVRHVLPKCVEDGARLMFPSPTFMGFKAK